LRQIKHSYSILVEFDAVRMVLLGIAVGIDEKFRIKIKLLKTGFL
jgi:hypothetical protein